MRVTRGGPFVFALSLLRMDSSPLLVVAQPSVLYRRTRLLERERRGFCSSSPLLPPPREDGPRLIDRERRGCDCFGLVVLLLLLLLLVVPPLLLVVVVVVAAADVVVVGQGEGVSLGPRLLERARRHDTPVLDSSGVRLLDRARRGFLVVLLVEAVVTSSFSVLLERLLEREVRLLVNDDDDGCLLLVVGVSLPYNFLATTNVASTLSVSVRVRLLERARCNTARPRLRARPTRDVEEEGATTTLALATFVETA